MQTFIKYSPIIIGWFAVLYLADNRKDLVRSIKEAVRQWRLPSIAVAMLLLMSLGLNQAIAQKANAFATIETGLVPLPLLKSYPASGGVLWRQYPPVIATSFSIGALYTDSLGFGLTANILIRRNVWDANKLVVSGWGAGLAYRRGRYFGSISTRMTDITHLGLQVIFGANSGPVLTFTAPLNRLAYWGVGIGGSYRLSK